MSNDETPRTLGDVSIDNLKLVIECRGCLGREGYYPWQLPGFPDQPVAALTRRRICDCFSKEFEVREVYWCMELDSEEKANAEPTSVGSNG